MSCIYMMLSKNDFFLKINFHLKRKGKSRIKRNKALRIRKVLENDDTGAVRTRQNLYRYVFYYSARALNKKRETCCV